MKTNNDNAEVTMDLTGFEMPADLTETGIDLAGFAETVAAEQTEVTMNLSNLDR